MLAETAEKPFTDPGWLFELKYDGFRVLAEREGGGRPPRLPRGESTPPRTYPEVARALAALPFGDLVLDGEVVVLDEEGRPSFQRLQQRAQQRRTRRHPARGARAAGDATSPSTSSASRTSTCGRCRSSSARRCCSALLPRAGPVRFVDHVAEQGEAFYAEVEPAEARGRGREARRRALPRRPLAALAEAAHRARGRLRGRGLHASRRAAAPASARCTSPPSRAARSSTAAGRAAASPRSSSSSLREALEAERRADAGLRRRRCRPTAATSGSSRGSSPRCAT